MFREIDRFEAATKDGKIYTVVERQRIVTTNPISGRPQQSGGAIDSMTACGFHLNFVEDGVYELLDTGERLVRQS